jgi:2-dehydropantoate 2-reductase
MRILVLGAGATGGYFGGRLLEAKQDVSFLVRPARALALSRAGLRIRSRFGDCYFPQPSVLVASDLREAFDLIVLSCKAYDLEDAIVSIRPAVGPQTAILPLLNGMRHLNDLDQAFGRERVLGGLCAIAATLNVQGEIIHLNDVHSVSFGERDGSLSARVQAVAAAMQGARFDARASARILPAMWEKWVFLAALAAGTCLLRASVGDIVASPGGTEFVLGVFEECRAIAAAAGFPVREEFVERTRATLTESGSPFTASMLRDIEANAPIEAEHIVGDLIRRSAGLGPPLLGLAYTHLKAYEARRARTPATASVTNR